MKRKTRLWLRFILLGLLVGGVYLLMRDYEQEFVYAPTSFVKKTPRDAGMPFDSIALGRTTVSPSRAGSSPPSRRISLRQLMPCPERFCSSMVARGT